VDPAVEDLVRSGVEETSEGQIVALGIDDRRLVVDAVRAALSPLVHLRADPVLLVENASIRRPLRSILERQLPEVCVLSYDELPRDIVIENAGRVTFADASAT
jgi:type III secretory pathway component EscV